MSYQVLARKYRPKSFDTLVGQEHVVRALTHALEQKRLHHAWLFTGTRGVGKTTLSRILAKALNCQGPDGNGDITAQPCGVCEACVAIDAGRFVDYIEMDAASNRGVDEMAQLLEQAVYAPSNARFKVYMIDEVHMLTNHAFNSMLKTLEEPPEHVKFILATTDPQKIPVTVLSRCLQFNLKQMPPGHIVTHLEGILASETIGFEVPALRLLAQAAHGSMRDALSLTDQAIAYAAGEVTLDAVQGMLGALDQSYLIRLLDALSVSDGAAMLAIADELAARSLSWQGALQDLGSLLHQIALAQTVPAALPEALPAREDVLRLAAAFDLDEIQLYYQIVVHGRNELGLAPDEYAGFTMTLLRMLAFRPGGTPDAVRTAGQGGASRPSAAAAMATASRAAQPVAARGTGAPVATPAFEVGASRQAATGGQPATSHTIEMPAAPAAAAAAPAAPATPAAALAASPQTRAKLAAPEAPEPGAGLAPAATPAPAATSVPASTPAGTPASATTSGRGSTSVPAVTSAPAVTPAPTATTAPAPARPVTSPMRAALDAARSLGRNATGSAATKGGQAGANFATRAPNVSSSPHAQTAPQPTPSAVAKPIVATERPAALTAGKPALSTPPWEVAEVDGPPDWWAAGEPASDDDMSAQKKTEPVQNPATRAAGNASTPQARSPEPGSAKLTAELAAPVAPPSRTLKPSSDGTWDGDWPALAATLPVRGVVQQLAQQSELVDNDFSGNAIQIKLRVPLDTLRSSGSVEKLGLTLAEHFGRPVTLETEIGLVRDTAHTRAQADRAARQLEAEQKIRDDPFVQTLMREFGATVVPGSIKTI
ncbi:MAG: polymerase subunit gamma and tau [Herminiimonas sp.]|nr:polymerase subunit gamma and tau [Herminiimonas sp.]MDB5853357.1 polymerase subunit gamma and tau [Herminiimonas sp.]